MSGKFEGKRPFVVTIANRKGGVGKTTTTLALGTILARRDQKVLLVDLDPQGNLSLSLGFKPHDMPLFGEHLLNVEHALPGEILKTETSNLDLVYPRTLIVDDDYQVQVNTGDDQYFLKQDLDAVLTLSYDYVLIDCPPTIGKIMVSALLLSDFLVIPTQADFYSSYALKDMMELVEIARREGNENLPYRILVTLFDRRNRTHHAIKNQLDFIFAGGGFKTAIETDQELYKSAILGFPRKKTRGVRQYQDIVDELLQEIRWYWF